MEKAKVLFLSPQPLWPSNTGARLRNFHLAHALGSYFDVTVLQALDPSVVTAMPAASPPPSSLQTVLSAARGRSYTPWKIAKGLVGPLPVTVLNYFSPNVERVLTDTLALAEYRVIQIESIHMAPYLKTVRRHFRRQGKDSPPVVLDWHNIESELARQYGNRFSNPAKKLVASRTAHLLYQLEQAALLSFSAHTVVSELERDRLRERAPGSKIHVIPNGVDVSAFAHAPAIPPPPRRTLLFVGSMDYHANSEAVVWFCREIWPRLAHEFPGLDFKIVGRNPPPAVHDLASSRITVTGTVPDVRPYYEEAFAVIVPLRVGGGTRLKILEAMAAGVPVISTRLGAQGIAVADGQDILLAGNANDMAAAVRSLFNQPDLAPRLSEAARRLVLTYYDWPVVGRQLADAYHSLIT